MALPTIPSILTLNAGSSSIKFAVFSIAADPERTLRGQIAKIGSSSPELTFARSKSGDRGGHTFDASDHRSAAHHLIDWLEEEVRFDSVRAVGHRVVHGMSYTEPQRITEDLVSTLRRISPYDPSHLPREIHLIEAFRARHPGLVQVACFDTAFHRTMPRVARLLAIPRRFGAMGVERYGFHGLSYTYLMEELRRLAGDDVAASRVILAHLGNGASLAAVAGGESIDTTMGFTPAGGLLMGTRPGDLDPGVGWHLMRIGEMGPEQLNHVIHEESGLLGISETTADMLDLLGREHDDVRSAEAVELFCYQTRKWIGAFAAALEGLDVLVFSGGIGENAVEVRSRICRGLEFLGVELDPARNAQNEALISPPAGGVQVRVIRTDEERVIARAVSRLVGAPD
jgi:acetate kinase